jgi:hypothetical protein
MQRGLVTLPNTISLSRIVLAVAFVLVPDAWGRAVLIAVAGFTDFMDGWLARYRKTESTAGALIDPLADRIFVFVAISTYLVEGQLTTRQYFLFLTRDIATAVGFLGDDPDSARAHRPDDPYNRRRFCRIDRRLHDRAMAGSRAHYRCLIRAQDPFYGGLVRRILRH